MTAIRVIPCLDFANGMVVKGENFKNLREMGRPVELAARHFQAGADELTFLDITATIQRRGAILEVVTACAEQLMIPLTVGGGVSSVAAVADLLQAGADKISVGSAGIRNPDLLTAISREFGDQLLVASLDVRRGLTRSGFELTSHGGSVGTGLDALDWLAGLQDRGVGEVLLNSIDADGTRQGFDLELLGHARGLTSLPIIASGGAGAADHFVAAARAGADALLAASIFHEGTVGIAEVKRVLSAADFEVRVVEVAA